MKPVVPAKAGTPLLSQRLRGPGLRGDKEDLPDFAGPSGRHLLVLRRSAQARRLRLSVDPRDGEVRLSLPARHGLARALGWVEERRGWIEAMLAKTRPGAPIHPGMTVMVAGEPLLLDWREDAPRTLRRNGDCLLAGGPPDMLQARLLRWLRREALALLDHETRALGARAGVTIGKVAVGDPKSRWGSCSAAGDIRYSWRLILMPRAVIDAIVAHEVAHRLHMDHSPAFRAAERRLLGRAPTAERTWLKAHGAEVHGFGR